jgi:hypothetical protein
MFRKRLRKSRRAKLVLDGQLWSPAFPDWLPARNAAKSRDRVGLAGMTPYLRSALSLGPIRVVPGSPQSGDALDERSGERGGMGQGDHVTGALDEGVFGVGHVAQNQLTDGVVDGRGG